MMYHLACGCGHSMTVSLAQAGTTVCCTQCHAPLAVPCFSELKKRAGDLAPHLDVLQKIDKALRERTSPFQGLCHQCQERPASLQIPVTFRFLVKRYVSEQEGIQPSVSPAGLGFDLVVGAAREDWWTIGFPFLFCRECHTEFTRRWRRSRWWGFAKSSGTWLLLAPLLLVVLFLAFFVPFLSLPGVILVILMAIQHRNRKGVDPFLLAALQKIPLVGEAIAGEDEYRISVDSPRRLASAASSSADASPSP